MAKLPWKPWHEVVILRDDLRSGELPMHMFAADLYEVMMQRGKRPIYEKPEHFFALTFPTYNLRHLVRDVVLRLAGKNDKAVRQLELTYGGGKTHTLITLHHLVNDPDNLPDLPAVAEFIQEIGEKPPKCRVASLCFDKLDVQTGMEVTQPSGGVRRLRYPWSVLAFQIAGDEGLRILNAGESTDERDSAPAENILVELLTLPEQNGYGTLVLIDEVLMYAREKVGHEPAKLNSLVNFFQYLTQAATKVDRCCIVASLLTSEPTNEDALGRRIKGSLYDIFQRQREEVVEPVLKEDVAEVLRRRFFETESIKDREGFRQHVVAALKGITDLDEQTAKQGAQAEERYLKSFPFHPDLTEVLYSKWTALDRFQRTRGVLRMFALALRGAEVWDTSPLVGPAVFLTAPGEEGLSEALREMVAVADTEETEGRRQAWTGILDNEFNQAQRIQKESVGLKHRELEQAVVATFLHSQPIGQIAHTRDLSVLLGAVRPDKIELEKGLARWAQSSHWLDDLYTPFSEGGLPSTWRLGNRPNLTQMHAAAAKNIPDDTVGSRLFDDISKTKTLTNNASAAGVRVHTLPSRPKDIEDDGGFHYAVLGPNATSESGKPSAEAKRFLEETTGADRPRVYRNAVLLVTPSKDGLELAMARVRDYLAWETVLEDVKKQQQDGNVDPARAQTLRMNIDKAKGRIPEAIKQAYSIIVTVSEKNDIQAFKIMVTDEPHFNTIKADKRARIQDTAVTAEALLPDGPYNLWREGETSRRVKDLAGAFAQLPHLPKMLNTSAILETLLEGCMQGTFVLRLTRPDGTARSWWMSRPDEIALDDPAMELVLPEAAILTDIEPMLLAPQKLPGLWPANSGGAMQADEITVQATFDYFSGKKIVQVDRGGYQEPLQIPEVCQAVVEAAISSAVETGAIWLLSEPASILGEPIPAGVLNASARLCAPPVCIGAPEILAQNLKDAWKNNEATALSIATALSQKAGKTLPWKTVSDVINNALHARFLKLEHGSQAWPCDFSSSQFVLLAATTSHGLENEVHEPQKPLTLAAEADLEPSQVQELGDIMAKLLELKVKTNTQLRFQIRIELSDDPEIPSAEITQQFNTLLKEVNSGLRLQ